MALKSSHPKVLKLRRRYLMLIGLLLPLSLALYSFVLQQSVQTQWPSALEEPLLRGKILAKDGTIFAEGTTENRNYPQGKLASHIVGFSGALQEDGRYGLEGLEYAQDATLKTGQDIMITIDPAIQAIAQANLEQTITSFEAVNGAVVILEAKTGRILASASYPDYDPNSQNSLANRDVINNQAFLKRFEPGSVMKPFVVASLLDSDLLTTTEEISSPMHLKVGDKTFRDVAKHEEQLSVWDIMRYSSNSGMINIGQRFNNNELRQWLSHFGFGQDIGLQSAYTRTGQLRKTPWVPQDHASITIGQSMSTTALQLAAAYSIFANNGYYVTPYLIEGTSQPTPKQIISEDTALTMRSLLRYTVEHSSLRTSMVPGISVAGKTGTADIFNPQLGAYVKGEYTLTFAGMVPAEDPQFIMVATVQKPKEETLSTYVAAPLFSAITSEVIALWQLPNNTDALALRP